MISSKTKLWPKTSSLVLFNLRFIIFKIYRTSLITSISYSVLRGGVYILQCKYVVISPSLEIIVGRSNRYHTAHECHYDNLYIQPHNFLVCLVRFDNDFYSDGLGVPLKGTSYHTLGKCNLDFA
jgi:hypothetical protein